MIPYSKSAILFGIKSALIWRKNLIASLCIIKSILKTKTKCYDDEVTDFYAKEIPNTDSNHTCLAIISLDSALNKDGNYYRQVFLKELKYIKKIIIRHIIDGLESSSHYSDDSEEE